MGRRVFVSYGRDKFAPSVAHIVHQLRERGHEIWKDDEQLRAGLSWPDQIDQALHWLRDGDPPGCFLLFMTPHSVRVPDGFCSKELHRALSLEVRIIPVMLADCAPPLQICNLHFVDMRSAMPIGDLTQFRAGVDKIAREIEDLPAHREATAQARLAGCLQPLEFRRDIEHHLSHFTGRQWILDQFDGWLQNRNVSRVFWIVGGPGVGKTALVSFLAKRCGQVAALHMCRFGELDKADPRRCLMSIAYQLSTQLPDYERALQKLPLESLVGQGGAEYLFDRLLVQPLWQDVGEPAASLVILIDALDESMAGGNNDLVDFIAGQFPKTPPWLRLMATSRPDPEILAAFAAHRPVILDAASAENQGDLRAYVEHRLNVLFGASTEAMKAILNRSDGSFLYAKWVCTELLEGRLSLRNPEAFPKGLGGIYRSFFKRQFSEMASYRSRIRPALQMVMSAQEPLPLRLICGRLSWGDQEEADFLQSCGSLISSRGGSVQPFHRSVADWCTDKAGSGQYYVSVVDGHHALAELGWQVYSSNGSLSGYLERHLPKHLLFSGQSERLEVLLSDITLAENAWKSGLQYEWMNYWQQLNEGSGAGHRYQAAIDELIKTGADEARIAQSSDLIGWFLREMGYDTQARPFIERALAWREQNLPASDPKVAASLHNLAELCRRERDFVTAHRLHEQVLDLRRNTLGREHPEVASSLHDIAELYHDQKLYADAKLYYEQSLEIRRKTLSPHDPKLADSLNDLGTLLFETEDRELAFSLYDEAEQIYRSAFGPNHPDVAAAIFNKAQLLEPQQSWPLFIRSLEILERIFPRHHHKVQTCRTRLGRNLGELGVEESAAAWEEFIAVQGRVYGSRLPGETAEILESMVWSLLKHQPDRALAAAERALEIQESVSGPESLPTASALNTTVRCLQQLERYAEALPLARRALAVREKLKAPPEDLGASLNNLGLLLFHLGLGQYPEAESVLGRALEVNNQAPFANYWLGRLYQAWARPGDDHKEAAAWRAHLERGSPDAERRAYAESRLAAL